MSRSIDFIRTGARARAYGHTIIVREDDRGEKPWLWQVFPTANGPGERAHGWRTTEAGARTAAKKALAAIPMVAEQMRRERVIHWNGEPASEWKSMSNYASATRKCGAAEGSTTNDVSKVDCAACLAAAGAGLEIRP